MMPEQQQTNLLDGSPSDPASIPIQQNSSGFYEKTNATLALVLAILGIACGTLFLTIPALIIASKTREVTDRVTFHPDAEIAKIAYIVALVGTIIHAFLAIVGIAIVGYILLTM
tara:strand:- start:52 stop:393 length:342 start_codon:yes stop_codon:yes gene_type:complete